jgi:hypothetical protein
LPTRHRKKEGKKGELTNLLYIYASNKYFEYSHNLESKPLIQDIPSDAVKMR